MSSSDASRMSQADELMHAAKKHMQKGFMKKPKYDDAADEFDRAAKLYAHLQNVAKASEAFQSASYAHEKAKNDIFAARSLEQLGTFLAEDMASPLGGGALGVAMASTGAPLARKPPAETAGLLLQAGKTFEDAAKKYAIAGKLDKQGDMLTKAASAYQRVAALSTDGSKAEAQRAYTRVTEESLEVMENAWGVSERKPYQMPDMYRRYIQECIRAGNLRGAVQAENRLLGIVKPASGSDSNSVGDYDDSKNIFRALNQPANAAKAGLEIVVLCLSSGGDDIWARQELDVLGGVFGFCGSPEEQTAAALIAAFTERDDEALQEAVQSRHCLNFIMADISRLAKKLVVGGGGGTSSSAATAVAGGAGAAHIAPPAGNTASTDAPRQVEEEEFIDPEEDLR